MFIEYDARIEKRQALTRSGIIYIVYFVYFVQQGVRVNQEEHHSLDQALLRMKQWLEQA